MKTRYTVNAHTYYGRIEKVKTYKSKKQAKKKKKYLDKRNKANPYVYFKIIKHYKKK